MAILPRHLAPAGAPIAAADLVTWLGRMATDGDGREALRADLRARFGERTYVLTSTGRAGMTVLLRAMRRLAPPDRDEVVIPTYTCYSVAASVVRAGLRIRLVDIDPVTLDYAADALAAGDYRRALAIVGTNLYGLPSDMPALTALARAHGAFLIDDAAQAMGASLDGRFMGTWGDAGLFSFDKGKNVSAIDGGVVTTTSAPLGEVLRAEMASLTLPSFATGAAHIVKVLTYAAMLRPTAYGVVTRVPGLGLGQTRFTTDYPIAAFDPRLAALGATMLRHLDDFAGARRANAAALTTALAGVPHVVTVQARPGAVWAALRLPVLCDSEPMKRAAIAALNAAGIGATGSYPASLADVPEAQPHIAAGQVSADGGREVARRLVTLPTHPFVTPADIARAADVLAGLAGDEARAGTVSAHRLRENH